jgi:hypothetical protein
MMYYVEYIILHIISVAIVNMTDECKAAVAALLPTLTGADMSFLPGFVVNAPKSSSDLLDSSSSNDDEEDTTTIASVHFWCRLYVVLARCTPPSWRTGQTTWKVFLAPSILERKEKDQEKKRRCWRYLLFPSHVTRTLTKATTTPTTMTVIAQRGKLASPASQNVKDEENDDDDGFYGDLRNAVQPRAQIDFSKIKWSEDFWSDSNDEAAGGSEQNDKKY